MLIGLSHSLQSSIRDSDFCARWGGEESLALLAGADLHTAQLVANRLLNTVRSTMIEAGDARITPRVSIGIAQHLPGETYPDVYRRADAALLLAKQSGRDRFVLASDPNSRTSPASSSVRG